MLILPWHEKKLKNQSFRFKKFDRVSNKDHEHCCICWARISDDNKDIQEGFVTTDASGSEYWVCNDCFDKYKFALNLVEGA